MAKKKILSKALEGIASLFKSKSPEEISKVGNVFAKNLVDEFGIDEVREAYRIIDTADKDPQLSKLFYREGESKMDDLVNLLEARYMSSERLQAHPLSFNRRGPGAADRYSKLNETGERLTDMPGGPGDRVLYFKHYGEMSGTTNSYTGQPVYKNKKATIFDEGTKVTDEGTTIEGKVIQDSLYDKTIADMPLINRMMKETGKTETEIREAIADLANQGYEAGSPKRMSPFDDDSMRAFVTNKQAVPGETESFVDDMMEALGEGPISGRTASVQRKMDDMISGMTDESDQILQNMKKMEAEAKAMTEIARAEQTQVGEAIEAFNRMMDDGEDPAEALQFLQDALKKTRTKQADGGRVEMGAGGRLLAEGIMQAAKLASRGIKPFGQKQTYKQKVKTKGISDDQFKTVFEKQLNRVPDEVVDQPTGEGLAYSLRDAEDILTGVKLGLLSQAQRTKIATAIRDKVSKQIYDNPVPGLGNEYLEYMDDAIGRMDDLLEIEKLGGDLTPKPVKGAPEFIQTDFTQLNRLRDQGKDNIIPFKPREKKFKGGIMGLLRRINPRLEKEMVETGPFQTGHRGDIIGDMQQIKNISRSDKATLEQMDALYDMVQESPRYNEAMRGAMMKLVDYERFRAILLEDNVKLQRMIDIDPEGSEEFIRRLFRAGGSEPQFSDGGAVAINKATLEAIRDKPLRSRGSRMPYVQKMKSDMEKYMRMGKQQGGHISEQEFNLMMQRAAENQSAEMAGRAFEAFEAHGQKPTMVDEPPLGLFGNITDDFKSYNIGEEVGDDLFLNVGMAEPPSGDPMFNFKLTKQFANGGTVPPQKGPMSQGMGTLYRSK